MLLRCCCAIAISLLSIANAQAPAKPDVKLFGDRFKPLQLDQMTPQQKTMIDHLLAGERRGTGGPFNVLLRSPEMGDVAQQLGAQLRFHTVLAKNVQELVIISTARYWMAQYEWAAHKRAALQAGVNPAAVEAIQTGKHPGNLTPDETVAYNFASELLNTKQVSDASFQAAKEKFGERGVVDMVALSGYYSMVSMLLNVDRYPMADGAQPELKAMAKVLP